MKKTKVAVSFILAGIVFWGLQLSTEAKSEKNTSATEPSVSVKTRPSERPVTGSLVNNPGGQALFFIRNDGQTDQRVLFYERGSNHTTFFTKEGLCLNLMRRRVSSENTSGPSQHNPPEIESHTLKLSFLNGNKDPLIVAEDEQKSRFNFFLGNDPAKWQRDVPTYGTIIYKEVYRNIDIKFYGNNGRLEYDVVVKPGGDPGAAKFRYEGTKELKINALGELEIALAHGTVTQKRPFLYQEVRGQKRPVEGRFKQVLAGTSYGFEVASYDRYRPLIIDPVIEYSGYLGGDWYDIGYAVAIDDAGNAYITGKTLSTDFSGTGYIRDTTTYHHDVFVTKLDPDGVILYSTVFGGTYNDEVQYAPEEEGNGIAVDSSGNAYVVKINSDGSAMAYSTYLGGFDSDYGHAIAVGTDGSAYVTGYIYGTGGAASFPTVNPIQAAHAGTGSNNDAFVTRINPTGSFIVYSTYLGGSGDDSGNGIAVDTNGTAYITGFTGSAGFPVYNPINGHGD